MIEIPLLPPVVMLSCEESGESSLLVRAAAYDRSGDLWDWQHLLDRDAATAYPELIRYVAEICMCSLQQKMLHAGVWESISRLEH